MWRGGKGWAHALVFKTAKNVWSIYDYLFSFLEVVAAAAAAAA